TVWQYTHGVPDATVVSPDGYSLDNFYLKRPGAAELQLDLFGDYKSNVALYRHSKITFVKTNRPCWRDGARMIRSSCRQAPWDSSATSRPPSYAFPTPAISR